MKPLGDRVILEGVDPEDLPAGLVRPDSAKKEEAQQGKIIAIGPDVKKVEVGQVAIFAPYSPHDVKLKPGDDPVMIIEEGDILAIK